MSDLDSLVRRVDEDRWLASRFAPRAVRQRLVAIYALNYEIARTAEAVTQEAIGDIRLAWWSEAIGEIHSGKPPRAHPVLQAYADATRGLTCKPLDTLIEARSKDLDAAPFTTWADLDAYLDATAGGVMRLAAEACGEPPERAEPLIRAAARAWGYVGLLRSAPIWRARGRSFLPRGIGYPAVLERAHHALQDARALSPIPAASFPALGYLALAPRYLSALSAPSHDFTRDVTSAPLILRQLTLVRAAVTGRL